MVLPAAWGDGMAEPIDPGLAVELRQTAPIPLDVVFECRTGELVALIGPSGAGKTTILRAIAGLYRPVMSRVRCNGEVWSDTAAGVHRAPHERRVGLVFQTYALFPHLTALDNVEVALEHKPREERSARAQELLGVVQLGDLAHRKPAELSGGQQQRVALARALAREPLALLLDEPLSAVDRPTRRYLRKELSTLRSVVRVPIVLVTHDLDEAAALADHLVVIDKGVVLQCGPPAEILASPNSDRVRKALDLDIA